MNTEGFREERKQKLAGMMRYFGLTMGFFYIAISAIVLFTNLVGTVDANTRYLFSAILFLYGCFRLYRVFASKN